MKPKTWVGFAALAIILALLLSAGCERGTTATATASPDSSPTAEQPTATPSLPPTHTPTPTPTPVPPTPTPTPTLGELTISQLNWYAGGENDTEGKSYLVNLLLETSFKYPLLFEALVQKPWVNPAEAPSTFRWVNRAIDLVRLVASSANSEAAAIQVLSMPFLDALDGGEWEEFYALRDLLIGGPGPFHRFLENAIANGGLTDSDREVDIYLMYMEAQDPAGMDRIFEGELPDPSDIFLLEDLVQLYAEYPDAYSAASEHFHKNFAVSALVSRVHDLAVVDEQLAQRLAQMPFNGLWGVLDSTAWVLMTRAAQEDVEATAGILETHEMGGGVDDTELAVFLMDIASVFAQDTVETIRTFDWVADGLDAPRFREDDGGTRVIPSDEERAINNILWAAYRNEPWLDKLLAKNWLKDDLTPDEDIVVNRLSQVDSEVTGLLLGMEFLDEIDREDSSLLVRIRDFLTGSAGSQESQLSELLNDSGINGEITDANRHLVEAAIENALERHGLGTGGG